MVLRSISSGAVVLALAAIAAGQDSHPAPNAETIVARMLAAKQENQARMHPYVVTRDYQLLDLDENKDKDKDKQVQPRARVIASIAYEPPDRKQYNIESSSGGIGGKVLRDLVQKETESAKEGPRREISPQNYDFQLVGQETLEGRNCYVLTLNPRREDKELIRGKLWVDAADYRIHRLEGNPVKSPSWWIRDIHILIVFASVDGMWLHTFTHAVADVRFKGQYVMESRDLEYRPVVETAGRRRRNPAALVGAAVNR